MVAGTPENATRETTAQIAALALGDRFMMSLRCINEQKVLT